MLSTAFIHHHHFIKAETGQCIQKIIINIRAHLAALFFLLLRPKYTTKASNISFNVNASLLKESFIVRYQLKYLRTFTT